MKKLIVILFLVIISTNINIKAKEVCINEQNKKICTNLDKTYRYENTYTYQDKTQKVLLNVNYLKYNLKDNSLKSSYFKEYKNKLFFKSTSKVYDNKKLLSETITSAYSTGKISQIIYKEYVSSKKVYELVKKYRSNGYIYYYSSTNTKSLKKIYSISYNTKGIAQNSILTYYNKSNVRYKTVQSYYYNGKTKYKVYEKNYVANKISTLVTSYYKKTSKNQLYSRNTLYYNTKQQYYKRVTNYYHSSLYIYNGFKNTFYNTSNKYVTSEEMTKYYVKTRRLYSKTLYNYLNGKKTQQSTTYYSYYGVKSSVNTKKYSSTITSDITTYYSNNKAYVSKGYTYQKSTYQYVHNEYLNGIIKLADTTTYLNKTITKTNYNRKIYDKNGKLINQQNYVYKSGEMLKYGTSSTVQSKSYPVSKGVITSPSWHYPASFGSGWHPGIDVATYSTKDYGYAQPIKVFQNATVIKRYNSCSTTNSQGCGNGFGNYLLVAVFYENKYYTILYGHQTKLDSKKSTHKKILDQDKKGYLKDEVIGFVGSSGYSTGYHIHIQIQEHTYAKSIDDIKNRYKANNYNPLFNVSYNNLGNNNDIFTINPDILFNLKYGKSW